MKATDVTELRETDVPTSAPVVEAFEKNVEVLEALTKRVLQLECDKRSLEGRLSKVEKKLNTIAMRHSD